MPKKKSTRKSVKKTQIPKSKDIKDPIYGWKWIFYIIGWVMGVFNLLFWGILVLAYLIFDNKDDKFFSNKLRRRVFYWGLIMGVFIIMAATIAVFFFMTGASY